MIDYIFNKAVMQHAFSSMYADLCRLVGEKEEIILNSMVKVGTFGLCIGAAASLPESIPLIFFSLTNLSAS